jgi:hypothetical protein
VEGGWADGVEKTEVCDGDGVGSAAERAGILVAEKERDGSLGGRWSATRSASSDSLGTRVWVLRGPSVRMWELEETRLGANGDGMNGFGSTRRVCRVREASSAGRYVSSLFAL